MKSIHLSMELMKIKASHALHSIFIRANWKIGLSYEGSIGVLFDVITKTFENL